MCWRRGWTDRHQQMKGSTPQSTRNNGSALASLGAGNLERFDSHNSVKTKFSHLRSFIPVGYLFTWVESMIYLAPAVGGRSPVYLTMKTLNGYIYSLYSDIPK
ncbi:hypothetical protein M422DRAFT_52078 [Sphaerobolus stellatus SS14]|uniref:Uncharacterized protein n=1 Tax=Sphaerobolus stellatus (strain SS14) TaxID=990650 RepID=A0A0C9VAE7_SPHS4|nr:hypothetical protein M422DRAFT_52078 [Sphaerobolus stellatus SS14]